MKSRTFRILCCVAFAIFVFSADPGVSAQQRSSGSSSQGSSRPSSPKPAPKPQTSPGTTPKTPGGYGNTAPAPGAKPAKPQAGYGNTATKPGTPATGTAKTPAGQTSSTKPQTPSAAGYGNTAGGTAAPSAQSGPAPKTEVQKKMERSYSKKESAKALNSYKQEQSRYKMSAGSKPYSPSSPRERSTIDSVRSRVTYSEGSTYYTRRNVFYTSYGWSAPPYIYTSYSSFGIWDAMMLWFMIDHIRDDRYASMYYHHRDDPGMQQFRKEADRLSVENAELREKLKEVDQRTKDLEAKGVKTDPTYVPDDAASIALASSVVEKEVQQSSDFPWGWTIGGGLAVLLAAAWMMKKRRSY